MDAYVRQLRSKVDDGHESKLIRTVRGNLAVQRMAAFCTCCGAESVLFVAPLAMEFCSLIDRVRTMHTQTILKKTLALVGNFAGR